MTVQMPKAGPAGAIGVASLMSPQLSSSSMALVRGHPARRATRSLWVRVDPNTGKAMFFFKDPDGLPLEVYEH